MALPGIELNNIDNYTPLQYPIEGIEHQKPPSSINNDETIPKHARTIQRLLDKFDEQGLPGKEYVEMYLRSQYLRNCRLNTIRNSFQTLQLFFIFIKRIGKERIEDINRHDAEAFIEHEQDRGLKATTVKTRMALLKAFFRFLLKREIVGEDAFPWKMRIKLPETLPRAIDPEDVNRILEVNASVRDRAMILLLLRTGMRIGELRHTMSRDVSLRDQKILIYESEKNRIGRVVYFSDDARDALKAWLEVRDQDMELLFYGLNGNVLSYTTARNIFTKYLDNAGLTHKGYSLHCLRHTYATDLLNALIPIECLEKLLGHKSLEVTRRYARLSDKTREEQYFKAMAIIERRQSHGHDQHDSELQEILEKTQLLSAHGEELHEHP